MIRTNIVNTKLFIQSLLLAFLCCTPVKAQHTLRLTVRQEGTRQPIEAARVTVAGNRAMAGATHTVTDRLGNAYIRTETPKTLYYEVSAIGYVPRKGDIQPHDTVVSIFCICTTWW